MQPSLEDYDLSLGRALFQDLNDLRAIECGHQRGNVTDALAQPSRRHFTGRHSLWQSLLSQRASGRSQDPLAQDHG